MDDIRLHTEPKRHSHTSSDVDPEPGVDRDDQSSDKEAVERRAEAHGLQLAKLDKLKGWRLWVTIVWYVKIAGASTLSFAYGLVAFTNRHVPLAVSLSGSSCPAWSRAS